MEDSGEFIDWETALGLPTESLDDDIKGTDELKLSTRLYKTEEEISKFSVNEDLDDIQRTIQLLRNGALIQQLSVINNIPKVARERRNDIQSQVMPVLGELLPSLRPEVQLLSGNIMLDLLEEKLLATHTLDLLHPVAQKMLNSKDEDVSSTWADVVIKSVQLLSMPIIERDLLQSALNDAGLSQPAPLRIWSCRVLGAVVGRLDSERAEMIFKRAITLCQDTDYEVRACMCFQMNAFAKVIKLQSVKRLLMDEYIELLMDEEDFVREAALTNMVQLLEFIDDSTKSSVIVPIWKRLCDEQPAKLMPQLSRDFGPFFYHTRAVLSDSELRHFMAFFHGLVFSEDVEQRAMCAFNFPAIVLSIGRDSFETYKLDRALLHLSGDQFSEVRERIAAGFHETPHFDEYLFMILRRERECAADQACPWRVYHELIKQFEYFPSFFDSDNLNDHAIPLLFKLLSENWALPIKKTVIWVISVYLRQMRRSDNRDRIIRQIQDIRESPNCHTRLLFLWFMKPLFALFSFRFMRETFYNEFLTLARDPVPNIRLKFVSLVPLFRKALYKFHCTALNGQGHATATTTTTSSLGGGQSNPSYNYNAASSQSGGTVPTNASQCVITGKLLECLMSLTGDKDRDVSTAAQDELLLLGFGISGAPRANRVSSVSNNGGANSVQKTSLIIGLSGRNSVGGAESSNGGDKRDVLLTEEEIAADHEKEEFEDRQVATELEEEAILRRRDVEEGMYRMGNTNNARRSITDPRVKGHRNSVTGSYQTGSVGVGIGIGVSSSSGSGIQGGGSGAMSGSATKKPSRSTSRRSSVGGMAPSSAGTNAGSSSSSSSGSSGTAMGAGFGTNRLGSSSTHKSTVKIAASRTGSGSNSNLTSFAGPSTSTLNDPKRGKSAGPSRPKPIPPPSSMGGTTGSNSGANASRPLNIANVGYGREEPAAAPPIPLGHRGTNITGRSQQSLAQKSRSGSTGSLVNIGSGMSPHASSSSVRLTNLGKKTQADYVAVANTGARATGNIGVASTKGGATSMTAGRGGGKQLPPLHPNDSAGGILSSSRKGS
ncbi:Serine/threonine-protein phosphatase 4 regulatory subunit 4 [Blyttiomyces sp. JEL0837]|nr:Serine/threonine-protein phosphatase 4 regulatory subunit 4 [Blyttiomyces sp. JEL0837]